MKVIENKEHDVKDVLESQAVIDEIMTWHDILVIKKTKDTDAIAIEISTDCQRERERERGKNAGNRATMLCMQRPWLAHLLRMS